MEIFSDLAGGRPGARAPRPPPSLNPALVVVRSLRCYTNLYSPNAVVVVIVKKEKLN